MVPSPLMSESKARKALLSQRSSSRAVLPCLLLSALISEQLVFHPQSLAGLKLVEANTDFQLKKIQRAQSRQRAEKAAAGAALLGGTGLLWDHMLVSYQSSITTIFISYVFLIGYFLEAFYVYHGKNYGSLESCPMVSFWSFQTTEFVMCLKKTQKRKNKFSIRKGLMIIQTWRILFFYSFIRTFQKWNRQLLS